MTDFIASYREYLTEEKHSSANTLSSYIRDLTQFQSWLLSTGVTDMRKVKKDTINEYLLHMTHSGKSPATVTRSTASIKSFYAYMAQCGAVKTNPAKSVVAMKVERKYPEILTNQRGGAVSGTAGMRGREGLPRSRHAGAAVRHRHPRQ